MLAIYIVCLAFDILYYFNYILVNTIARRWLYDGTMQIRKVYCKTKYMLINKGPVQREVLIANNQPIERVSKYTYLCTINETWK